MNIDLKKVKTIEAKDKKFKVDSNDFSKRCKKGASFSEFMETVPKILAGNDFRKSVDAIVSARKNKKEVVFAIGGHVIKCGLSPLIIQMIENDIITAIAMNGASAIHDSEIALFGKTSETVENGIDDGSFGMSRETGILLNDAAKEAQKTNSGFGETLGRKITEMKAKNVHLSILAAAFKKKIPATVHVAIGTDTVHMHPNADGSAIGAATFTDFRIFSDKIANLEGGVYANIGSAVIMPEIFLKAITLSNNLGFKVRKFTAITLDFEKKYRENENVVKRPTMHGGEGFYMVGQHEILLPMLTQAIIEKI